MNSYYAIMSSGLYTIEAANAEDAAWQALELSEDTNDFLLDIVNTDEY
jgi:hypothetical protein